MIFIPCSYPKKMWFAVRSTVIFSLSWVRESIAGYFHKGPWEVDIDERGHMNGWLWWIISSQNNKDKWLIAVIHGTLYIYIYINYGTMGFQYFSKQSGMNFKKIERMYIMFLCCPRWILPQMLSLSRAKCYLYTPYTHHGYEKNPATVLPFFSRPPTLPPTLVTLEFSIISWQ